MVAWPASDTKRILMQLSRSLAQIESYGKPEEFKVRMSLKTSLFVLAHSQLCMLMHVVQLRHVRRKHLRRGLPGRAGRGLCGGVRGAYRIFLNEHPNTGRCMERPGAAHAAPYPTASSSTESSPSTDMELVDRKEDRD